MRVHFEETHTYLAVWNKDETNELFLAFLEGLGKEPVWENGKMRLTLTSQEMGRFKRFVNITSSMIEV